MDVENNYIRDIISDDERILDTLSVGNITLSVTDKGVLRVKDVDTKKSHKFMPFDEIGSVEIQSVEKEFEDEWRLLVIMGSIFSLIGGIPLAIAGSSLGNLFGLLGLVSGIGIGMLLIGVYWFITGYSYERRFSHLIVNSKNSYSWQLRRYGTTEHEDFTEFTSAVSDQMGA